MRHRRSKPNNGPAPLFAQLFPVNVDMIIGVDFIAEQATGHSFSNGKKVSLFLQSDKLKEAIKGKIHGGCRPFLLSRPSISRAGRLSIKEKSKRGGRGRGGAGAGRRVSFAYLSIKAFHSRSSRNTAITAEGSPSSRIAREHGRLVNFPPAGRGPPLLPVDLAFST